MTAGPIIATVAALGLLAPGAPVHHDETISYQKWESFRDWRAGDAQGTVAIPAVRPYLAFGRAAGTTSYEGKTWEVASWTSPRRSAGNATQLVASWNADAPAGTWLQVELQGTYANGQATPSYVMGRWAKGDGDIKRTSVDDQADAYSSIDVDTFKITDPAVTLLKDYRLKVTLYRTPGTHLQPRVWELGAMASNVPDRFTVTPSAGHIAWGKELPVPRYSQNVHVGEYPEYDGGGEAWCSPTSTEMVVEYWGRKPSPQDLAWVDPAYQDPQVDFAARSTYDYAYEGAGNWPFNTAYAATFGLKGIITRMHSLDEVEHFINAGIPVITSQSFLSSELTGAGYGTAGHLFVIVGFTATGDVVVNDPASHSNDVVRHVYKRSEFENIWLRTKRYRADGSVASGSGGIAYLISPVWKPWPHVPGSSNF
jgi:hypothetical protein